MKAGENSNTKKLRSLFGYASATFTTLALVQADGDLTGANGDEGNCDGKSRELFHSRGLAIKKSDELSYSIGVIVSGPRERTVLVQPMVMVITTQLSFTPIFSRDFLSFFESFGLPRSTNGNEANKE